MLVGNRVAATATFTDETGAPLDPTTVRATIQPPQGTATTYTYGVEVALIKTGTGAYRIEFDLTEPGSWVVRIESDGVGKAAVESEVIATRSGVRDA